MEEMLDGEGSNFEDNTNDDPDLAGINMEHEEEAFEQEPEGEKANHEEASGQEGESSAYPSEQENDAEEEAADVVAEIGSDRFEDRPTASPDRPNSVPHLKLNRAVRLGWDSHRYDYLHYAVEQEELAAEVVVAESGEAAGVTCDARERRIGPARIVARLSSPLPYRRLGGEVVAEVARRRAAGHASMPFGHRRCRAYAAQRDALALVVVALGTLGRTSPPAGWRRLPP